MVKFFKDIFDLLTFKNIVARVCPSCQSFNVHRVLKDEDSPNFLSILIGTQFKCYDCGFKSILFPEKKFKKIKNKSSYEEVENGNEGI